MGVDGGVEMGGVERRVGRVDGKWVSGRGEGEMKVVLGDTRCECGLWEGGETMAVRSG